MPDELTNPDLDLTLLHQIADGSDGFINESIDMFLELIPSSLQEISDAFDAKNWATASCAAHRIKATLGFFGMLNSQALLLDIEESCKTGAPNVIVIRNKLTQIQALLATSTITLLKIKEASGN